VKKRILVMTTVLLMAFPTVGRTDLWGGDLVFLAQLVVNSIQQLIALKNLVSSGKDTLDLMKDINQGVNDSLRVIKTVYPNLDPGIYKDWENVEEALRKIQEIYGVITPSKDSTVQEHADSSVAEAVALNNSIYNYTRDIDRIGEEIKEYSHDVSPGGAQKLTAQTLGVMLHVMNQSLRTQATGLKLQAQTMALNNKKEKDATKQILGTSAELESAMKNENVSFGIPRFGQ